MDEYPSFKSPSSDPSARGPHEVGHLTAQKADSILPLHRRKVLRPFVALHVGNSGME